MKIIIATVLLLVLVSLSSIPNSYAATFDCPDTNSFVDSIETMGAGLVVSIVCTLVDFTDIEALIDALDVRVTDNEFDISNNTADIQTLNSTLINFQNTQLLNNTGQQILINNNTADIQSINSTLYPPPPLESSDYLIVELDRDNIEFGDADLFITVTTDNATQWTALGVIVELVGTTTNSGSDLSYLEFVNFVNNTATLYLDGDSELEETGLYRLDTFGNSNVQGDQNTEMYFYYWIFDN